MVKEDKTKYVVLLSIHYNTFGCVFTCHKFQFRPFKSMPIQFIFSDSVSPSNKWVWAYSALHFGFIVVNNAQHQFYLLCGQCSPNKQQTLCISSSRKLEKCIFERLWECYCVPLSIYPLRSLFSIWFYSIFVCFSNILSYSDDKLPSHSFTLFWHWKWLRAHELTLCICLIMQLQSKQIIAQMAIYRNILYRFLPIVMQSNDLILAISIFTLTEFLTAILMWSKKWMG